MELRSIIDSLGTGFYLIIYGVPLATILILINLTAIPEGKFIICNGLINTIIGLSLLLVGIFLWLYGVRQIKKYLKSDELYTEGFYAYIRHPLYSIILIFIVPALVILVRLILGLLLIPLLSIIFHFTIKIEESRLIAKFGQKYIKYMKKTKRLIPKIY